MWRLISASGVINHHTHTENYSSDEDQVQVSLNDEWHLCRAIFSSHSVFKEESAVTWPDYALIYKIQETFVTCNDNYGRYAKKKILQLATPQTSSNTWGRLGCTLFALSGRPHLSSNPNPPPHPTPQDSDFSQLGWPQNNPRWNFQNYCNIDCLWSVLFASH